MKGDFSRSTFRREKHYNSVRMQQGRVQLDADWNEAQDISAYLEETAHQDIIGRCGAPKDNPGFELKVEQNQVKITSGHFYVDGILCEHETETLLTQQPDLPGYTLPNEDGEYLAYLDVWDRHVTLLEDPDLREIALGPNGPDTTTRTQTLAQVKLHKLTSVPADGCKTFDRGWFSGTFQGNGRLKARVTPAANGTDDPCLISPQARYQGPENQLYRVEVHRIEGDKAWFKWSRDNGAVVAKLENDNGNKLQVSLAGQSFSQPFVKDQWVEITDKNHELRQEPQNLYQLEEAEIETNQTWSLALKEVPDLRSLNRNGITVRRWESRLVEVSISSASQEWLALENGIEIQIEAGKQYQAGDYWLIPARIVNEDVLWPKDGSENPLWENPHGIEHHYCALALLRRAGSQWQVTTDCRKIFPSLTELDQTVSNSVARGCCVRVEVGGDIQRAIDEAKQAGGGCICLAHGVHQIKGPLFFNEAHNISLSGESSITTLTFQGKNEDNLGGIVLTSCSHIEIKNLLIVGDDINSVVQTRHNERMEKSHHISIIQAVIINRSQSEENTRCVFRLVHSENIKIKECRLVAEVGVVSLWGNKLPKPEDISFGDSPSGEFTYIKQSGDGICSLEFDQSTIQYEKYGIFSITCKEWTIHNCEIRGIDLIGIENSEIDSLEKSNKLIESIEAIGNASTKGTALKSLALDKCIISSCNIQAKFAACTFGFFSSTIVGNKVFSVDNGFRSDWINKTQWIDNEIVSENGSCLSFVGSNELKIQRNKLKAQSGIKNLSFEEIGRLLDEYLLELSLIYQVPDLSEDDSLIIIILLNEDFINISNTRNILVKVREVWFGSSLNHLPLSVLSSWIFFVAMALDISAPIIHLEVENNEIKSMESCIDLRNFWSLVGIKIIHNNLSTFTGRCILCETYSLAANPPLVIYLWDLFTKNSATILAVLPTLIDQYEDIDQSVIKTAEKLLSILTTIKQFSGFDPRHYQSADYRIESNTILSCKTAIESNIFEFSIINNHITLVDPYHSDWQENISGDSLGSIASILSENDFTKPLEVALSQGNVSGFEKAITQVEKFQLEKQKTNLIATVSSVSEHTQNPRLKETSRQLIDSLNQEDINRFPAAYQQFVKSLQEYNDSYGILAKGFGWRIVGNQILTSVLATRPSTGDTGNQTLLRGGIRISTRLDNLSVLIALSLESSKQFGLRLVLPPVVGITENLIDSNEIFGGWGHGIDIEGDENLREALSELKIHNNQISGMGGAGIFINELAVVLGLNITNNNISSCSKNIALTKLLRSEGGIEISTSATCRIENNICTDCGSGSNSSFAINLSGVYSLCLTNNQIVYNQSGGIQLQRIFGSVNILSNEVRDNQGTGFQWIHEIPKKTEKISLGMEKLNNERREDFLQYILPYPLNMFRSFQFNFNSSSKSLPQLAIGTQKASDNPFPFQLIEESISPQVEFQHNTIRNNNSSGPDFNAVYIFNLLPNDFFIKRLLFIGNIIHANLDNVYDYVAVISGCVELIVTGNNFSNSSDLEAKKSLQLGDTNFFVITGNFFNGEIDGFNVDNNLTTASNIKLPFGIRA